MRHLRWEAGELVPGPVVEPEITTSFLLDHGRVVGLSAHQQRFAGWVPGVVPVGFFGAVRDALPREGQWFPRIGWDSRDGHGRFGVTIRPAPPLRHTSSLWIPDLTDPRRRHTVKGPDLPVLARLRTLATDYHCDDALLIDEHGVVLEAANAAVVFWRDPDTVILPARPALASVTLRQTLPLWRDAGITILRADTRQLQLPAWCGSALHGWTPVTHWGRGAGRIKAAPAPPVERWNEALWEQAEEL